jgi:hypothetical protein
VHAEHCDHKRTKCYVQGVHFVSSAIEIPARRPAKPNEKEISHDKVWW